MIINLVRTYMYVYIYIGKFASTIPIYRHIVTKGSGKTFFRDLFPYNAENSTNTVDNNDCNVCNNITTRCCSIDYCNHTIIQQVQCFVNGDNLFA